MSDDLLADKFQSLYRIPSRKRSTIRLTMFPLDGENGVRLDDNVLVVEGVLPAEVLVSSRGK